MIAGPHKKHIDNNNNDQIFDYEDSKRGECHCYPTKKQHTTVMQPLGAKAT
jgi:hypothetical protein